MRCPAVPCSSAQQRTTALAQQSAARCSASLCRAPPCCVLCCTFTNSCMPIAFEILSHVPVLLILHHVCIYYVVGSQTMHPQLWSARLYIAQQRSVVRCCAVPCPSFCGAVSCSAVRCFEHSAVVPGMIQIPGTIMCVMCTRLLAFFS